MQNFTTWLYDQNYRNDLVGELSELAQDHDAWPETDYRMSFDIFMHQEDATDLMRHAFNLAYAEWQESGHLPPINVMPAMNSFLLALN